MRVSLRVWRPIARRWGAPGVVVFAVVIALLIGGGGVYAALNLGGVRQQSVNLQSGLVGWWKFDGNVNDSSSSGNNLTNTGATATTDRTGKANSAYSFNGTNNYMTGPSGATALGFTTAFSLSAWIKPTSYHTTGYYGLMNEFLAKGNSATYNFALQATSATSISFIKRTGSESLQIYAFTGISSLTNNWSLVTTTYSGSTLSLYINGTLFGTKTVTSISPGNNDPLYVGSVSGNSEQLFAGSVDDVRMYNRALNATEAKYLYTQHSSKLNAASGESGLLGWWKFNGNAHDSGPSRNNATVSAATLTTDRKGQANNAYNFNGTSSYITLPGPVLSTNATIAGWFNYSSTSTTALFRDNTCAGGWLLWGNGANFSFRVGGTEFDTSVPVSTYVGKWTHFAITKNGSSVVLYVNGAATYTGTGAANTASVVPWSVMRNGSCGTPLVAGSVQDLRMYGRALSATEVSTVYNSYNSQVNVLSNGSSNTNLYKGLVGQWNFNGNTHDSTPYRAVTTNTAATLTTDRKGRANSAYSFDGSTSHMNVASLVALGQPGLTISAWINPTSLGSATYAIVNRNGPVVLWIDGTNKRLYTGLYKSGTWYWAYSATNSIIASQWQHVVMTYNGTSRILYVNGVQSGPTDTQISGNIDSVTGSFAIGYDNCCSRYYFPGAIDDVNIWTRALSQAEVTALYQEYR